MADILPFRDPSLPLEGIERLRARRLYREICKTMATETVARTFSASFKAPGIGRLGCDDAVPIFVAAMRRELRKMGLF